MEIAAISAATDAYVQVVGLHKRFKRWLGLLPYEAFERYADAGTLIAAVEAQEVLGYALYWLPSDQIALAHLCVADSARGRGIARELVDWIAVQHPSRRGIRVRCRRDYPVAGIWEHLDFEPVGDLPGKLEGSLLTQWWRDFGHPTLFTIDVDEGRDRVALDTDVFLDIVEERPAGKASSQLAAAGWLSEQFELVITKQVQQELNHHEHDDVRARQLRRAATFARADGVNWQPLERRLIDAAAGLALSEHDRGDIRHVARASAAGARFFVSRDGALNKRWAARAPDLVGVTVLSPTELVTLAHERTAGGYAFASIEGTAFSVKRLSHNELTDVTRSFVDSPAGERATELRQRVEGLLADVDESLVSVIRDDEGMPVGLIGQCELPGVIEVPIFRLAGAKQSTIGRQLAFQLRDAARRSGRRGVRVNDVCLSSASERALASESYVLGTEGWVATTIDTIGTATTIGEGLGSAPGWFQPRRDWAAARQALAAGPDQARAAELEQRFWPLRISDAPLPTYLVPIKPGFADALFDPDLNAQTLFNRPADLGIAREHVYYKSANTRTPADVPGRILWYVTKSAHRSGTGCIRAVSTLVETATEQPERLFRRFEHLGVFDLEDVRRAAGRRGQAMALRFVDTLLFEHPVELAELEQGSYEMTGHGPLLRTVWTLPTGMFEWIYRKGRGDAIA